MKRLRDRMLEDLEVRGLRPNTRASYLRFVEKFTSHFDQPPANSGPTTFDSLFSTYLVSVSYAPVRLMYVSRPLRSSFASRCAAPMLSLACAG